MAWDSLTNEERQRQSEHERPSALRKDPERILKETLFELLRGIRNDELNFVDRNYGGVHVDTEDGLKVAYLRLSFEEPSTD